MKLPPRNAKKVQSALVQYIKPERFPVGILCGLPKWLRNSYRRTDEHGFFTDFGMRIHLSRFRSIKPSLSCPWSKWNDGRCLVVRSSNGPLPWQADCRCPDSCAQTTPIALRGISFRLYPDHESRYIRLVDWADRRDKRYAMKPRFRLEKLVMFGKISATWPLLNPNQFAIVPPYWSTEIAGSRLPEPTSWA